jgi:hypothetical protein
MAAQGWSLPLHHKNTRSRRKHALAALSYIGAGGFTKKYLTIEINFFGMADTTDGEQPITSRRETIAQK